MTEQDAQSNGETARLLARDPVLWQYIDEVIVE